MARIRTVKPEFWTSEQVAECSPIARLLFIGIWTFADDRGIHPASIKRLKMEIFPSDEIPADSIQAMVCELVAAGLLVAYETQGKGYWLVTGWGRHQKIDKPTYRHPQPGTPEKEAEITPPSLDNSAPPRRAVADKSPIPRVRNGMESKGSKPLSGNPDALDILSHLNGQAGKNFRPVKANIGLIEARMKEGATSDECKAVIDAKVTEWQHDPKMCEYLRPETLFGATKFAGYVGQLSSASTSGEKGYL